MKRHLIIITLAMLAALAPARGQSKLSRDALRYNQMNEQGVWNVGVSMEPMVGLLHPLSDALGGGCVTSTGVMGFGIEGGYFVANNMRISASFGFVSDQRSNMFLATYDGVHSLSRLKFRLGGHWHIARWDVGGGLLVGNTTLRYVAADTANGGVNDERFGSVDVRDRHTTLGLFYEAGFMISPFLRLGSFWEPSIAFGGGYSHSFGAKLTIYLPFINSVVCK